MRIRITILAAIITVCFSLIIQNAKSAIVDFSANRDSICFDSCVYFTDLSSGNPIWWEWTFGASNSDATVGNTASNMYNGQSPPCVKFHTPGPHNVTLEIHTSTGHDTSITKTAYIYAGACPDPSISSTIPTNDTICSCKCVQFFYTDPSDPFAHEVTWYFISTSAPTDTSTEASPTICFTTPGVFYVVLVDNNGFGKDSLVWGDSITVIHCLKPAANIDPVVDTICTGTCVQFHDASCNTPTKWSWIFPGGNPDTSTIQNPPQVCYTNTGNTPITYTVKMVDTNAFGFDSAYATIIVLPLPCIGGISNILKMNNTILVYPNPATTLLNIHQSLPSPNQQLIITDLLGTEVYKEMLTGIDNTISISTWSAGIYFYEVRSNTDVARGKFVKEL